MSVAHSTATSTLYGELSANDLAKFGLTSLVPTAGSPLAPRSVPATPVCEDPYAALQETPHTPVSASAVTTARLEATAADPTDWRYGPHRVSGPAPDDPFDSESWIREGWPFLREFETTRLRGCYCFVRVPRLGAKRGVEAVESRRRVLPQALRFPEFVRSDIPVLRHPDEVSFLRNLANLKANNPTPRYSFGQEAAFHIDRVCTNPVQDPYWTGCLWVKRLRDEFRYRQGGRHAPLLVRYDAVEFNFLHRGNRDASFARRPEWWPDLEFPAVPLPAIFVYRTSDLRDPSRDASRVLWEVSLADWVVADLSEVVCSACYGELLHVPEPLLANFWQVDLAWFASLADSSANLVREALFAIRNADWSRFVVRNARRSEGPFPMTGGQATSTILRGYGTIGDPAECPRGRGCPSVLRLERLVPDSRGSLHSSSVSPIPAESQASSSVRGRAGS